MPPDPSGRLIRSSRIRRYGVWYATRVDSCSIAGPEVSRTGLTLSSSLDGPARVSVHSSSEQQVARGVRLLWRAAGGRGLRLLDTNARLVRGFSPGPRARAASPGPPRRS